MEIKPDAMLVFVVRIKQYEHAEWDNGESIFSVAYDKAIWEYLESRRSGYITGTNYLSEDGDGHCTFTFTNEHCANQFMIWFKLKYGAEDARKQNA